MDVQFCPSPTLAETKALASLPSAAPLKYERVHEILADILSFCERPEINGFLFTQEPIQVSHFLKANIFDESFTGKLLATRVEPGRELNNTMTDHATGSFVLCPAFVSQNISYGFALNNIVYSPANTWETKTGLSYNSEVRYVRDNEKRVLLCLADAEEVGIMQFQYTHQISTTCQFRTVASFVKEEFRAVTANICYDVTDVLGTLSDMHIGLEYRLCPLCAAPHGECQCVVPTYQPKHPFDREMVLRNIQMHLGSFEGSANVAFMNHGKFSRSASVGSRVTLQGMCDRNLVDRLRRWALKRHCGSSPWESCLVTNDYRNEEGRTSFSAEDSEMAIGAEELLKPLERSSGIAGSFLSPHEGYSYLSELLGSIGSSSRGASDTTSVLTNPELVLPDMQEASMHSSGSVVRGSSAENFRKQGLGVSQRSRQTVNSESRLNEMQKMKEERRKEQNRMSARKSNQKKKAFNDALKRNLRDTQERAASLRARELHLRRENLELRRRLEGH